MSSQTDAQENHSAGIAPAITPAAPWRVAAVTALPNFCLALTFNDGVQGTADLSTLIAHSDAGVFAPLRDPAQFAHVGLVYGAVTWPNGADLDPCWMHEEISRSGAFSV
jgi:hypothetical protein